MDRSKLRTVGARDQYEAAVRDVANAREQIGRTQSLLQELRIQQSEKEQQLDLDLLTTYNDLRDNLARWEQRYLFRAPFDGRVEFLDFWRNGQFVQSGEEAFTIVPEQERAIGHVTLPAMGAGKVTYLSPRKSKRSPSSAGRLSAGSSSFIKAASRYNPLLSNLFNHLRTNGYSNSDLSSVIK